MKLVLLKLQGRRRSLNIGLLAFAVNLLLASVIPAEPADTRIAFMSLRSGNGEIYLMNTDGKRVRRLTRHFEYDAGPDWSPDGQKIAFVSFRDKHQFRGGGPIFAEIYVMNTDGANPINLTQSPERADLSSSWSPDGKQVALGSIDLPYNPDIWVIDADGGNPRNLTNHHAIDRSPAWSPAGTQIAFHSNRNRDWEFEHSGIWGDWEIYVMNTDGANLINLTNHPAGDLSPAWSPDGKQIAFSSNRDGNGEVYVMNADGTNPINLTNHPAADREPAWSLDGRQIAFSTNRDGNWEIYVMNADGTNPINLTNHPAWDSSPSWGSVSALTLSIASNGKLATSWGKVKRTNTYSGR